jgi:K+-sensing histidine kinase KdpD
MVLEDGMERILVPVVTDGQNIRLIIHGMQLAERIGGTVYILEIDQSECTSTENVHQGPNRQMTVSKALAATAHKKEVKSEYFLVKGRFCDEIIKFCDRYSITNLVLELTPICRKESPARILEMINILKDKKNCRVELVGRK